MHNKAIHFGRKNIVRILLPVILSLTKMIRQAFGVAILMGLTGAVYWLGYREMDGHHTAKSKLKDKT